MTTATTAMFFQGHFHGEYTSTSFTSVLFLNSVTHGVSDTHIVFVFVAWLMDKRAALHHSRPTNQVST